MVLGTQALCTNTNKTSLSPLDLLMNLACPKLETNMA